MTRNKAQSIVDFSLLIALVIVACVIMQPFIKRACEGKWRAAADEMGYQFSPRWTNTTKVAVVNSKTLEQTRFGNVTRTTTSDSLYKDTMSISVIKDESAELRTYLYGN